MIDIEFNERKDGTKVAGVKVGNTVHVMTCEEWRNAAVEIIAQISAYLEEGKPKGEISIVCEYCRHPYPINEKSMKIIKKEMGYE